MRARSALAALVATLSLLSTACRPEGPREAFPGRHGAEEHAEPEAEEHEEPAAEGHGEPGAEEPAEALSVNPAVIAAASEVPSLPVVGFEGPDGASFRVVQRTDQVLHYPCTSCHVRPIGTRATVLAQLHSPREAHEGAVRVDCFTCHDPGQPGALVLRCAGCHERNETRELMPSPQAHLTVKLSHPTGRLRNCFTCHAPENPGMLALPDGDRATMDEAYRLCGSCHFMQARDWAGGAHGKRLAGWRGERVILSCPACHNPHSPKFPVRRPVTFPKIARREASH